MKSFNAVLYWGFKRLGFGFAAGSGEEAVGGGAMGSGTGVTNVEPTLSPTILTSYCW
jgi:hypothetical protein